MTTSKIRSFLISRSHFCWQEFRRALLNNCKQTSVSLYFIKHLNHNRVTRGFDATRIEIVYKSWNVKYTSKINIKSLIIHFLIICNLVDDLLISILVGILRPGLRLQKEYVQGQERKVWGQGNRKPILCRKIFIHILSSLLSSCSSKIGKTGNWYAFNNKTIYEHHIEWWLNDYQQKKK